MFEQFEDSAGENLVEQLSSVTTVNIERVDSTNISQNKARENTVKKRRTYKRRSHCAYPSEYSLRPINRHRSYLNTSTNLQLKTQPITARTCGSCKYQKEVKKSSAIRTEHDLIKTTNFKSSVSTKENCSEIEEKKISVTTPKYRFDKHLLDADVRLAETCPVKENVSTVNSVTMATNAIDNPTSRKRSILKHSSNKVKKPKSCSPSLENNKNVHSWDADLQKNISEETFTACALGNSHLEATAVAASSHVPDETNNTATVFVPNVAFGAQVSNKKPDNPSAPCNTTTKKMPTATVTVTSVSCKHWAEKFHSDILILGNVMETLKKSCNDLTKLVDKKMVVDYLKDILSRTLLPLSKQLFKYFLEYEITDFTARKAIDAINEQVYYKTKVSLNTQVILEVIYQSLHYFPKHLPERVGQVVVAFRLLRKQYVYEYFSSQQRAPAYVPSFTPSASNANVLQPQHPVLNYCQNSNENAMRNIPVSQSTSTSVQGSQFVQSWQCAPNISCVPPSYSSSLHLSRSHVHIRQPAATTNTNNGTTQYIPHPDSSRSALVSTSAPNYLPQQMYSTNAQNVIPNGNQHQQGFSNGDLSMLRQLLHQSSYPPQYPNMASGSRQALPAQFNMPQVGQYQQSNQYTVPVSSVYQKQYSTNSSSQLSTSAQSNRYLQQYSQQQQFVKGDPYRRATTVSPSRTVAPQNLSTPFPMQSLPHHSVHQSPQMSSIPPYRTVATQNLPPPVSTQPFSHHSVQQYPQMSTNPICIISNTSLYPQIQNENRILESAFNQSSVPTNPPLTPNIYRQQYQRQAGTTSNSNVPVHVQQNSSVAASMNSHPVQRPIAATDTSNSNTLQQSPHYLPLSVAQYPSATAGSNRQPFQQPTESLAVPTSQSNDYPNQKSARATVAVPPEIPTPASNMLRSDTLSSSTVHTDLEKFTYINHQPIEKPTKARARVPRKSRKSNQKKSKHCDLAIPVTAESISQSPNIQQSFITVKVLLDKPWEYKIPFVTNTINSADKENGQKGVNMKKISEVEAPSDVTRGQDDKIKPPTEKCEVDVNIKTMLRVKTPPALRETTSANEDWDSEIQAHIGKCKKDENMEEMFRVNTPPALKTHISKKEEDDLKSAVQLFKEEVDTEDSLEVQAVGAIKEADISITEDEIMAPIEKHEDLSNVKTENYCDEKMKDYTSTANDLFDEEEKFKKLSDVKAENESRNEMETNSNTEHTTVSNEEDGISNIKIVKIESEYNMEDECSENIYEIHDDEKPKCVGNTIEDNDVTIIEDDIVDVDAWFEERRNDSPDFNDICLFSKEIIEIDDDDAWMDSYQNRLCICGNKALVLCECKKRIYCSHKCKKEDWVMHSKECLITIS